MIDYSELKELAMACGFSHVGDLDADTIEIHPEVRDYCVKNKCQSYNRNWVCPPGCGTLEECEQILRRYKRGLILQTTGALEDSLDYEGMMEAKEKHGKHMNQFSDEIRRRFPGALIIGDSQCQQCKVCTYPTAPCRFPDKKSSA